MGVTLEDKVTLIAPQGTVTPAGVVPRLRSFTVVGIFEAGMYEYDSGLALIDMSDAQLLYRLGDGVSGVRLKLDDLFRAPRVARELVPLIQEDAYISDWTRSHATILRTLGASPRSIMAVFVVQGALIGVIGLGLGVVGGVALALNIDVVVPFIERVLGTQFLAKDVYYISQLPSELQWGDVTGITAIAFVLALAATLYPSWRASRVNPAEALRYE